MLITRTWERGKRRVEVSAAVAVDSSRMTASSSASWSRFSPPSDSVNGHVSTMWLLATITGKTPFVQVSTTWVLTCLETVHQRPCVMREMETWLSDSRVGNNSVVEHRSRRPVLSPLRNCVDRCHVWPHWASRCKPWTCWLNDISIHRPIWLDFDDVKHIAIDTVSEYGQQQWCKEDHFFARPGVPMPRIRPQTSGSTANERAELDSTTM